MTNSPLDAYSTAAMQPHEIDEYTDHELIGDLTPEQYVQSEEGTYNPANGHFYCTACYVEVGMPLGKAP
jgi:hypothetical protein